MIDAIEAVPFVADVMIGPINVVVDAQGEAIDTTGDTTGDTNATVAIDVQEAITKTADDDAEMVAIVDTDEPTANALASC